MAFSKHHHLPISYHYSLIRASSTEWLRNLEYYCRRIPNTPTAPYISQRIASRAPKKLKRPNLSITSPHPFTWSSALEPEFESLALYPIASLNIILHMLYSVRCCLYFIPHCLPANTSAHTEREVTLLGLPVDLICSPPRH